MKSLREIQSDHLDRERAKALREANRAVGGRFDVERIAWDDPQMSFKKLREAVSESAFPQLLRAGVQNLLFDAYQAVDVIYPELVRVVNSNKFEELYAPLYGTETLKEVKPGMPFEESRLAGLDSRLKNKKFGRMLAVERELVDDDMTGQIQQKASQFGERARYTEETEVMNALIGATYNSTLGNVNTGGGQLSQTNLEAADVALSQIVDPLGNLIMVNPDTLVISPLDKFNAAKLLHSTVQPSVPGAAGQTAATAGSGITGWTGAINPLQGLYRMASSRFLLPAVGVVSLDGTHGPALLMQAKTALVFQDRDPLEVAPEATNSGVGFTNDVIRWRVRRRFASGMIESRYAYRIN